MAKNDSSNNRDRKPARESGEGERAPRNLPASEEKPTGGSPSPVKSRLDRAAARFTQPRDPEAAAKAKAAAAEKAAAKAAAAPTPLRRFVVRKGGLGELFASELRLHGTRPGTIKTLDAWEKEYAAWLSRPRG
jgi:hypothetical protein